MAIYDNNGTTNFEIGKVYDNNGAVNSQIGKVYDNNGTTDSLIYTAELQLYPGNTATTNREPNTEGIQSVGTFFVQNYNTSGKSAVAYMPINMTGWNTCEITVDWDCEIYGQLFVGISPSINLGLPQYLTKTATAVWSAAGEKGSGNKTYTLNIATFSGTQYIGIASYSGSVVTAWANAKITKILLK